MERILPRGIEGRAAATPLIFPFLRTPAEFGCSSVRGKRGAMEDAHIAVPHFVCDGPATRGGFAPLFAVFDGHGGRHCAQFLK